MAEAIARDRYGGLDLTFASAGTLGITGKPMTSDAVRVLDEIDVEANAGVSRSLDSELIAQADVIYAMEPRHRFWIINRWPDAEEKVELLDPSEVPIEDPYGFPRAEYRLARDAIVSAIDERAAEWG